MIEELKKDKEAIREMRRMLEILSRPDHKGNVNLDDYERTLKAYAIVEKVPLEELRELLETPIIKKRFEKERFYKKHDPYHFDPTASNPTIR